MFKKILGSILILALASTAYAQNPQQAADAAKATATANYAIAYVAVQVSDSALQACMMKSSEAYMKYYSVYKPAHGRDLDIEAALAAAAAAQTLAITPYNQSKTVYNVAVQQFSMGDMAYMQGMYLMALESYAGSNASWLAIPPLCNTACARACEAQAKWQDVIDMCAL